MHRAHIQIETRPFDGSLDVGTTVATFLSSALRKGNHSPENITNVRRSGRRGLMAVVRVLATEHGNYMMTA